MNEETLFQEALSRLPRNVPLSWNRPAQGGPNSGRPSRPSWRPTKVGQHPRQAPAADRRRRTRPEPASSHPRDRRREHRRPATAVTDTDYRPTAAPASSSRAATRSPEKIGEGGMGEVWVAKQTEPVKRKVALKLIKTGMDSEGGAAALRAGAAGPGDDGPSQHRQGARRRPDARPASRSSSWSWSTACR